MWPGMRPATGWMAYLTSMPRLREQLGQLADAVLRLGDRHAVAGDDDDRAGAVEQARQLLGVMLRTVPLASAAGPPRPPSTLPKAPKSTFIAERFMARHISSESRKPEVPSSEPVMIWILFMSTKPMAASARPA